MADSQSLHFRTLADVARDIARGVLSAEAVTGHVLARIAELEPRLHAFAHVRAEPALADARAIDARRSRGEYLGPLAGVPVAVKDLCAMAGTPTRAGGYFDTAFGPGETATVVARLRAAGAVIIGKTQLTEGAWGAHHPDIPAPVNPWGAGLWSGASSSGSGVAAAAGLAYGTIGTDTAGSIRFPSAANHLVGLKPTWGRVSRRGVFPLAETFDHVGPMARSVKDVTLMFAAIAEPDMGDPTSLDADDAKSLQDADFVPKMDDVRIGLDPAYALEGLDESTASALNGAIDDLKSAGAKIVEVRLPPVRPNLERAVAAALVEAAIAHASTYPSQAEVYGPAYAQVLETGRATSAADYASMAIWRREFASALRRLFAGVDMLIAPVMPIVPPSAAEMAATTAAPPLGAAPLLAYTIPFNLAGVPCLTLPMGPAPSSAPLGFQLIGPDLGEKSLLAAGYAYELASGFAERHPDL